MIVRVLLKTITFIVLLQCLSLIAMAQAGSGAGAIGGTVQDSTGAVIPGVQVTLTGSGIGAGQEAVTDERGIFQFRSLVPGSYAVRAELSGFRSSVRENVLVNADVTARVDMRLEVGEVTDTIEVTGEAVLLDTTTALNQTVLDNSVISTIPSRNDLWGLAKTVPAVIINTYDVGGSNAFVQSNGTVHGASQSTEGAFTIDGFEFGSALNAGASLAMYVSPSSFQEVNYQGGNATADSSRGGLVYNMVSRTGTNEFHGSFGFSGSNESLQSDNITQALRNDLLASVPARVLAANPNLKPTGTIMGMFDSDLRFSGPILRDRVWFSASAALSSLNQIKTGSYNPDGSPFVDDNRKKEYTLKISMQLTPSQQIHFYHANNQKHQYHRTASAFAESKAVERQAPNNKYFQSLKWTATLSPKLLAELGASLFHGMNTYQPEPSVKEGDLPARDAVTQTDMNAIPTYATEPNRRGQAVASLSYIVGSHNFKFGYQWMGTLYNSRPYSLSPFAPSGILAIFRSGVPDSVNTYNTPLNYKEIEHNNAVYAQDKWTMSRKLTVSWGLRLQKNTGFIPATCQPTTVFIVGKCYDKIDKVPNFTTLSPRFAVIYDIFGDGSTALKFTANRYDLGTGRPWTNRINPVRETNDTRTWTDRNNDRIPQLDELGPSSGFNVGTTNRYSTDVKRPYSNELSVELEHQLPGGIVLSAAYFHRETRNNVGSKNLFVPRESYTPIQVTEVNSGKQVTVYNQAAATRGLFDVLWDNFDELDGQFNGLDLTFNKRLSDGWMVMGGLSYGRSKGDVFGTSDLNNPNFLFRRGLLSTDVPISFKTSGLYEAPLGINISGSLQRTTGFPERQTVSVSRNTVTLTQTSQTLDVVPRGTTRLPSVNMVDLSFRRSFNINEQVSVRPVMDMFNVLNINTVTARIAQLGPTYGRVSEFVRGRIIRLGLNIDF